MVNQINRYNNIPKVSNKFTEKELLSLVYMSKIYKHTNTQTKLTKTDSNWSSIVKNKINPKLTSLNLLEAVIIFMKVIKHECFVITNIVRTCIDGIRYHVQNFDLKDEELESFNTSEKALISNAGFINVEDLGRYYLEIYMIKKKKIG